MPSCQLCNGVVSIHGAVGVCEGCGAEYDVVRHGRGRGDFGTSAQLSIGGMQYPTSEKIYLGPSPMGVGVAPYPPGTVLYVGTAITVRMGIYSTDEGKFISPLPQNVTLWHKLDTGTWEKLWIGGWSAADVFDYTYTLPKSGTHTFYIEWPGTNVYAGCGRSVHAKVSVEYGSSLQVSLQAVPALTVIVKEHLTHKPIVNAKVTVNSNEALTDSTGTAIFDTLTPGTYKVAVSASNYIPETRTVNLVTAGVVLEIHMVPLWAVAAGVGGVGAALVVSHFALKKK